MDTYSSSSDIYPHIVETTHHYLMDTWKIGITGGMGAGKTLVASLFNTLTIPVYNADKRAKYLMNTDLILIDKIKDCLGEAAYNAAGKLDRAYVANLVFTNDSLLKKLNALVHPIVLEDGNRWHKKQKDVPYTLKEAALLYESGSYLYLDAVINVFAPEEIRIKRILARDKITLSQVKDRLQNQWPEERRKMLADFEVINDGTLLLVPQIMQIHQTLIRPGKVIEKPSLSS